MEKMLKFTLAFSESDLIPYPQMDNQIHNRLSIWYGHKTRPLWAFSSISHNLLSLVNRKGTLHCEARNHRGEEVNDSDLSWKETRIQLQPLIEIVDISRGRSMARPKLGRLVLGKRGACPQPQLEGTNFTPPHCLELWILMQELENEEQAREAWKVSRTSGALVGLELVSGKSHAF